MQHDMTPVPTCLPHSYVRDGTEASDGSDAKPIIDAKRIDHEGPIFDVLRDNGSLPGVIHRAWYPNNSRAFCISANPRSISLVKHIMNFAGVGDLFSLYESKLRLLKGLYDATESMLSAFFLCMSV